jgi:phage FluMu protein Com
MTLFHCRHCNERIATATSAWIWSCPRCGKRLARVWMPEVPRAEPGSYSESGETYASLEDFVAADSRRIGSPEFDFGLYWRDVDDTRTYRAAWIEHTAELYLVQAGAPQAGGGHVEVLAVADRAGVETALEGWRTRCFAPGSIGWLRSRATGAAQRTRSLVTASVRELPQGSAA